MGDLSKISDDSKVKTGTLEEDRETTHLDCIVSDCCTTSGRTTSFGSSVKLVSSMSQVPIPQSHNLLGVTANDFYTFLLVVATLLWGCILTFSHPSSK